MIPVFLQVLPLLSGVMDMRSRRSPRSGVGARLQPADGGDRGLACGLMRRRSNLGQTAIGVAVALVLFVGGLAVFRSSPLRGHDLMATAIEAHELSKKYRLGRDAGGVRDASRAARTPRGAC